MKKYLKYIIILFILLPTVNADSSFTQTSDGLGHHFKFANIIISPNTNVNTTNFTAYNSTDNPKNTLELWINGSKIMFNADTNKTISNLTYNNISDEWHFTVNGSDGYLNTSVLVNRDLKYRILDGSTSLESKTVDNNGEVWFNYTSTWSTHEFYINRAPASTSGGGGGGGGYVPVASPTTTPIPILRNPTNSITSVADTIGEKFSSFIPYITQSKQKISDKMKNIYDDAIIIHNLLWSVFILLSFYLIYLVYQR